MLKNIVLLIAGLFLIAGTAMAAVEVNTADQAALDSVAGVGPATSKAILEERKKNGNFKDWADLEQRVAELEATVQRLIQVLVNRGKMSIDDAREAHGLKPFDFLKGGE